MKEVTGVFIFLVKSIIVALLCFMVIKSILPDLNNAQNKWKDFSSKRENQALVFSFIQNPVALIKAGERDFEVKKYADAALKFELAVGLLEMHGASQATIRPYLTRYEEAKILASPSNTN